MKNKIFISIIMSLFIVLTMVGNMTVYAEEAPENIIYRNSVTTNISGCKYTANIKGSDNGHIKIDLQYTSTSENINNNLNISYNYNMIAELGDSGFAGISKNNRYDAYSSDLTYNYKNANITYNIRHKYYNGGNGSLVTFDLYVKEDYLNANQTLTILGQNVEIPFGEPVTDPYEEILELRSKNAELTSLVDGLRNTLNAVGNRMYGDMNGDGYTDGRDASILLTYYAKTSVGEAITLDEYIESLNNENSIFNFFN